MAERLHLGDVVISNEDNRRGIVTWAHGRGRGPEPLLNGYPYTVQLDAGVHRCSSSASRWTVVEPESVYERVQRASLRWIRPDWLEPHDHVQDPDSYAFACVRALLSPDTEAIVFAENADHPYHLEELVAIVARDIDERLTGARQLGAALARTGETSG